MVTTQVTFSRPMMENDGECCRMADIPLPIVSTNPHNHNLFPGYLHNQTLRNCNSLVINIYFRGFGRKQLSEKICKQNL